MVNSRFNSKKMTNKKSITTVLEKNMKELNLVLLELINKMERIIVLQEEKLIINNTKEITLLGYSVANIIILKMKTDSKSAKRKMGL